MWRYCSAPYCTSVAASDVIDIICRFITRKRRHESALFFDQCLRKLLMCKNRPRDNHWSRVFTSSCARENNLYVCCVYQERKLQQLLDNRHHQRLDECNSPSNFRYTHCCTDNVLIETRLMIWRDFVMIFPMTSSQGIYRNNNTAYCTYIMSYLYHVYMYIEFQLVNVQC